MLALPRNWKSPGNPGAKASSFNGTDLVAVEVDNKPALQYE